MNTKIKGWLDQLSPRKRALAHKIRDVVLATDSDIKEGIKWRNPTFMTPKGNIAWVLNYNTTDYINLGFFRGARLSDPKNLLEGMGKGIRHQKIWNKEDIGAKQIQSWIKEAIKPNKN